MNDVYFLHIPKTGGRFIRNNIFRYIGEQLSQEDIDANNINIEFSHRGIYPLKENQYSFSFFRNPVERTVSHYLFFNAIFSENFNTEDKNNMIDWIEQNSAVHNYQSKYLSYYDENLYENFDYIVFPETNVNDVKENISKLTRFHKTEDINNLLVLSIYNEIQNYLNISEKIINRPIIIVGTEINVASRNMYNLLSNSEKNYIANLNSVDMEIYNSSELFTP